MNQRELYINGNTLPKPEIRDPKEKEKYEELKKSKRESKEAIHNKRVKKKLKVMRNILVAFLLGLTLIMRYSVLYSTQQEINKSKVMASSLNSDNENLRLILLKNSNMKTVEEYAVNNFKMIYPDKSKVVYENINKNNFKTATNSNKISVSINIINKIKKLLF